METSHLFIFAAIGIALLINIAVSVMIARRDNFEKAQKVLQVLLVWLIPFLGGIIVWAILRSITYEPPKKPNKEFGSGPQDSGYAE
jgi:phosphate/sulfate permease